MRFQKGVSGNPKGRKKGALNKSTNQVRDILMKAHANNFDLIMQQINEMTLKERLQFNRDILPYIAPKLSNIAIKEDAMTYDEMVQDLQIRESLKTLSTDELLNLLKEEK
jgi:hypothetical protein